MGHPRKRVEGASALALAFVRSAETITRVKNLSMPNYRRLTTAYLNNRLAQVHRLCLDWQLDLEAERGRDMPQRDKYAPLTKDLWTAQGDNGSDPPMNVGVFGDKRECHRWCDRQNETQSQESWGRGSAGPMHFTPKPIHESHGLDPHILVLPERQWEEGDSRAH
jgi:hypothetical protein